MDGLTTILVVHETTTPEVRVLVALCTVHLKRLKRADWAGVDEVVGYSSLLGCEACALMVKHPTGGPSNVTAIRTRRGSTNVQTAAAPWHISSARSALPATV